MIISVILYWLVLLISTAAAGEARPEWQRIPKEAPCLTGYMTDVQSWVGEYGEFTRNVDKNYSIDLSETRNVVKSLEQRLYSTKYSKQHRFKYLSIANSYLTRVPSIFRMEDSYNRRLADTLEFLTVYGNNFGAMDPYSDMYRIDMNATDARELDVSDQFQLSILSQWSTGLHLQTFRSLRELDLRACSIQVVGANTFERMPELRKLYLSENNIYHIDANAFESLKSLRHLDLSRNYAYDQHGNRLPIEYGSLNVFKRLKLLESLDFSYTIFGSRNVGILSQIAKSLTRLSLCNTGLGRLRNITFNTTSIRLLDVSGNNEILSTPEVLGGLEQYLEILYAANVTLRNMDGFRNFSHLEILKLTNNEISTVPEIVAATLTNLKILDLDNNRMTSWPNNTFRAMPRLKLLSLKNNNINIITQNMYFDIEKLSFLGLAGNFLVCNCHARDLYEVASNNELLFNSTTFYSIGEDFVDPLRFHRGFKDYNKVIHERRNITSFCEERETCEVEFNDEVVGNYLLLDYEDYASQYKCLSITEGKSTRLYNVPTCSASTRDITDLDIILSEGWNKYLLLLLPTMLLPFMLCAYVFRKNFKYFLITVRNSAMLSLINKNDSPDDDTIFNYDVFVSYCNEDRAWVLDDLLPHVEKDCNISVCLHERDFQVGLSILENIVSCMDRSRMIMLIISKRFLLSQWCQFEMHLAQHRLLETRREDLILVLLEEIPKRLRPNTLHYLMLTKTYIVWPKEESEQNLFWKRMKKSLVTHKLRSTENVSLA